MSQGNAQAVQSAAIAYERTICNSAQVRGKPNRRNRYPHSCTCKDPERGTKMDRKPTRRTPRSVRLTRPRTPRTWVGRTNERTKRFARGWQHAQNIGDIFEHLKDVAVSLEANGDAKGVKEMYRLSERVCETQAELEAMKQTLHWMGLEGGYEGRRNEKTDFRKMMDAKVKECRRKKTMHPSKHESVLDIKQAVWEIHHPNEPFPGTADATNEEVVMAMTQSEKIARNKTCPISGRSIFEVADPVKDKQGYVYEKEYIIQMFQRGMNAIECPVAGTTHQIHKADLKPAKELLRERKRRVLTQKSRKAAAVNETILE